MADLLFLKLNNGRIIKVEGDNSIHAFVETTRQAFDHIQIVEDIYKRVSLIEHDPRIRDRIMARLFLLPSFTNVFYRMGASTDDEFKIAIVEFKDRLSYLLFPASMEFEREMERRFGSDTGGALLRSLYYTPKTRFSTYFEREWFM